jgi:hypothetical protein
MSRAEFDTNSTWAGWIERIHNKSPRSGADNKWLRTAQPAAAWKESTGSYRLLRLVMAVVGHTRAAATSVCGRRPLQLGVPIDLSQWGWAVQTVTRIDLGRPKSGSDVN